MLPVSALAVKGLTRKSCGSVLQTLSGLLRTAKAWGYIPGVFDRSGLSLPREGEKQEERFFTAEQVKYLHSEGVTWILKSVSARWTQ